MYNWKECCRYLNSCWYILKLKSRIIRIPSLYTNALLANSINSILKILMSKNLNGFYLFISKINFEFFYGVNCFGKWDIPKRRKSHVSICDCFIAYLILNIAKRKVGCDFLYNKMRNTLFNKQLCAGHFHPLSDIYIIYIIIMKYCILCSVDCFVF